MLRTASDLASELRIDREAARALLTLLVGTRLAKPRGERPAEGRGRGENLYDLPRGYEKKVIAILEGKAPKRKGKPEFVPSVVYECRVCHFENPKPTGRCGSCGLPANFKEVRREDPEDDEKVTEVADGDVQSLNAVRVLDYPLVQCGIAGVDRILGESESGKFGIAVKDAQVVQIYGGGGAGKSTLLLQMCKGYTDHKNNVMYVCGEETAAQVSKRSRRIGKFNSRMKIIREYDVDSIVDKIDEERPDIVVMDSLQSLEVDDYRPGSLMAVDEGSKRLALAAKEFHIAMFLVNQVVKSGDFQGPNAVKHNVDTSIELLWPSEKSTRRVLSPKKNRFAATDRMAFFEMRGEGLIEVPAEDGESESEPPRRSRVVVAPEDDEDDDRVAAAREDDSAYEFWRDDEPPKRAKSPRTAPAPAPPPVPRKKAPKRAGVPDDADMTLSVSCENAECKGKIGKGCTAADGTPNAGFHESRVLLARSIKRPGGGK